MTAREDIAAMVNRAEGEWSQAGVLMPSERHSMVAEAVVSAGFVRVVSDSDTVERVAKAIWLDECHRYADIPEDDWPLVAPYVKADYRRHARVAIEAMKETNHG